MDVHTVKAQMFVGNMSPSVVSALENMTHADILTVTPYSIASEPSEPPCKREECRLNWDIEVDESSLHFESDAFAREDFIMALQDYVRGMQ
jgi:hypothetical protein